MTGTPLPRSLDPAQGELLAGYLLRLAHRIGISPLDLAHRCGLTAGTTFPTHHLVRLDDNRSRQTATVCRLTLPEVHALTLATQAPNYPPLRPVYLGRHQSHIDMANDGWVFTAFSRYCPACLANTADLPGGSVWQGSWRLPLTFLCTRHHRILDWRCPNCQAPAFSNGYRADGRWRPTQLTPSPRSRLHPAQCRHRPGTGRDASCAQRLDHPSATGKAPARRWCTLNSGCPRPRVPWPGRRSRVWADLPRPNGFSTMSVPPRSPSAAPGRPRRKPSPAPNTWTQSPLTPRP
ncbi:TniQ family protein [Streptomyces sp. NPDC032198]|uniref:TniQ family protein n=1 Tax=Streptomyces sp. NPDC032198 TaxID=3155127 RepID=UPI0033F6C850